jgi:hypothetical protein
VVITEGVPRLDYESFRSEAASVESPGRNPALLLCIIVDILIPYSQGLPGRSNSFDSHS